MRTRALCLYIGLSVCLTGRADAQDDATALRAKLVERGSGALSEALYDPEGIEDGRLGIDEDDIVALRADFRATEIEAAGISLLVDDDPRYLDWLKERDDEPPVQQVMLGDEGFFERSIGGRLVEDHVLYGQVVGLDFDGSGDCSGVMLDRTVLVTAGHCLCANTESHIMPKAPVRAYFGAVRNPEVVRLIDGSTMHFEATDCSISALKGADFAVLRLQDNAAGAYLADAGSIDPDRIADLPAADTVRVVGMGRRSQPGSGLASLKMKNTITTVAVSPRCEGTTARGSDADVYTCVSGEEMVVERSISPPTGTGGLVQPVAPCSGDSGGAVFHTSATQPRGLVGIVSRTLGNGAYCGSAAIVTLLTPARIAAIHDFRGS